MREKEPTYVYERSEFEALSKKAFDTVLLLRYCMELSKEDVTPYDPTSGEIPTMMNYTHFSINESWVVTNAMETMDFDSSSTGVKYSEPQSYIHVKYLWETYKNVEDIRNYGYKALTSELTDKAMLFGEEKIEIYRYDAESGEMYIYEDWWYEKYMEYHFADFQNVKIHSDTKATVTVVLAKHYRERDTLPTYHTETIEFTKTSDGWRASGGTMFDVMFGEKDISPNTGDERAATIVIFVALALITMIIPFTLQKKRRTN